MGFVTNGCANKGQYWGISCAFVRTNTPRNTPYRTVWRNIMYPINLSRLDVYFQSGEKYENATKGVIISPAHQGQCAVDALQIGTNYLITGKYNNILINY